MSDASRFLDNLDDFDDLPEEAIAFFQQLMQYVLELEKAAGLAEDVSNDFLYAIYDQRDLIARAKRKWYRTDTQLGDRSGRSRLTKKKGICCHHTAVSGGFGPHRNLVKKYAQQTMDMGRFLKSDRELTPDEWARAMALAHRFWGDPPQKYNFGVPYHAISAANSVLYLNLPFDWVTWHGNGSNNDFLGYAWDAHSGKDELHAADLQADLEFLIDTGRDEGHDLEEATCHCAWTNKERDPDKEFIEQVLVPVAEKKNMTIDWDFKAKVRGARSLREVIEAA